MPVMFLMWVVPYARPDMLTEHWLCGTISIYSLTLLFLSSVNQFILGAGFYKGAYKALRMCSANMDTLVVLGTTAAWFYGFILIFLNDLD